MATPPQGSRVDVYGPTQVGSTPPTMAAIRSAAPLVDGLTALGIIGKEVNGYKITRELGKENGVYLAVSADGRKEVAIKIIGTEEAKRLGEGIEARLGKEATIILAHMGLVKITNIQTIDGNYVAITADFVNAQRLQDFTRSGKVTEDSVVFATTQTVNLLLDAERLIGTNVTGFVIRELIGMGGMGFIYSATNPTTEQKVAIKVLKLLPSVSTAELGKRFEQEARALALLADHPNIVAINNFPILSSGEPALVMNFVEGKNLADIITDRRLTKREVFEIFKQVFDALEYAHSKGVLHRDMKPANIIVKENGALHAKVADFGIARMQADATDHRLTQTGAVMGTPDYMPPELILGREATAASDVYSLAATIFEALTGRKLFGDDPRAGHLTKKPPHLLEMGVSSGRLLDEILQRALDKNTQKRFKTMTDFKRDFEIAMGQELGELGPNPRSPQKLKKPEIKVLRLAKGIFRIVIVKPLGIAVRVLVISSILVAASAFSLNKGWIKKEWVPNVSAPYIGNVRERLTWLSGTNIKDFEALKLEVRASDEHKTNALAEEYQEAVAAFRKFVSQKSVMGRYGELKANDDTLNVVKTSSGEIEDHDVRAAVERDGVYYRPSIKIYGRAVFDATIFLTTDDKRKYNQAIGLFLLEGNLISHEDAIELAKRFSAYAIKR